MNILVIFDTTFGCTRQIARTITCALEAYGTVECREAAAANALDVRGVDLLILGGPTQSHALSPAMRALVETLPAHTLNGVAAAAFDTRYHLSSLLSGSAAQILVNKLQRAGARILLPAKSFFVAGREGPLEDGEAERAEQWTHQVMERFEMLHTQAAQTADETSTPLD